MNSLCSSAVSGYYNQIKYTAMFYSLPFDKETAFVKGHNALCVIAEIDQNCMSNLCGSNNTTLNAIEKEQKTTNHETIN